MITLQKGNPCLKRGDYMGTIDLKDPNLNMLMNNRHKMLLRLVVDQVRYQFTVLSCRIKSAPKVFTKCLAVVAECLRRRKGISVYPCMDNWLVKAKTFRQCQNSIRAVIEILYSLGFPNRTGKIITNTWATKDIHKGQTKFQRRESFLCWNLYMLSSPAKYILAWAVHKHNNICSSPAKSTTHGSGQAKNVEECFAQVEAKTEGRIFQRWGTLSLDLFTT